MTNTQYIDSIAKKYNLKELHSYFTGKSFSTWFRSDKMFFIEYPIFESDKIRPLYRILPATNDADKTGHINFRDLIFDNFEEAAISVNDLNINEK